VDLVLEIVDQGSDTLAGIPVDDVDVGSNAFQVISPTLTLVLVNLNVENIEP
jgi:hypothetical protein